MNQVKAAALLKAYWKLFPACGKPEPVIDLASGKGRNGIYLAVRGIRVKLIDHSQDLLDEAHATALRAGAAIEMVREDLEHGDVASLPEHSAGGMLVFRYLHRPLLPVIKKALVPGGILLYETFTQVQSRFGKPRHPDHLLKSGELVRWFWDWEVIHYFEGVRDHPMRATAQMVCRKPG